MIGEKRIEIESEKNDNKSIDEDSIMSLLLLANTPRGPKVNKGSDEADRPMTDNEIRGILMEIIIGSIETVSGICKHSSKMDVVFLNV
jgi:hypothetical protein